MSNSKTLAEMALRCLNVLRDAPLHEKFAVINLMNTMVMAEAKSAELAMSPPNAQAQAITVSVAPADEHYQQ